MSINEGLTRVRKWFPDAKFIPTDPPNWQAINVLEDVGGLDEGWTLSDLVEAFDRYDAGVWAGETIR